MKLRIISMIWNIRKQKTIRTTRRKKNPKKKKKNKDSISSLWIISSILTFAS